MTTHTTNSRITDIQVDDIVEMRVKKYRVIAKFHDWHEGIVETFLVGRCITPGRRYGEYKIIAEHRGDGIHDLYIHT